ncbi:PDGLE domain-containing protein [Nocardioides exalbidus]|uniref:PDGLE domain-containing protein n=1 Tax=Nocardioides exalbidus TaxID=402596 RepID=UPI001586FCDE|nr:PDGLE domain-containing protein [Nocardioides exalbidus]
MSKRPSNRAVFVSFLLVSLLVAGVVSYYASAHPDGLNYVAEKTGFIDAETTHASSDSPLAGYSTKGVDNDRLSGGIAGVVGVLLMLLLSTGLFRVLRRRDEPEDESADDHADESAGSRG